MKARVRGSRTRSASPSERLSGISTIERRSSRAAALADRMCADSLAPVVRSSRQLHSEPDAGLGSLGTKITRLSRIRLRRRRLPATTAATIDDSRLRKQSWHTHSSLLLSCSLAPFAALDCLSAALFPSHQSSEGNRTTRAAAATAGEGQASVECSSSDIMTASGQ